MVYTYTVPAGIGVGVCVGDSCMGGTWVAADIWLDDALGGTAWVNSPWFKAVGISAGCAVVWLLLAVWPGGVTSETATLNYGAFQKGYK